MPDARTPSWPRTQPHHHRPGQPLKASCASLAFAAATIGYLHRRRHRPGDTGHIPGMGGSFTVMLTAFYVDNGPHLPLWDHLPSWAFWLLPAVVAAPLIARSLHRTRTRGKPRLAEGQAQH